MTEPRITPLTERIGGRVEGLSLDQPLSDQDFDGIRRALLDWKVLVFANQRLDAASLHGFARRFGPLQQHVLRKYRHAQFPDLSWLTNVAADGSVDTFGVKRATAWHSDGSYSQDPPALGMLYAFEVPSSGGGTLFADMCHACETLGSADLARLEGLTGLHRHGGGPAGEMYDGSLQADQAEGFEDAVHPAITTHPESGRRVLYVNSTHTRRFAELEPAESVALIERLMSHATTPDNVYAHQWSVGDLLIWDQRSTIHRGAGDYPPTDRRVKLRAIVQSLD